MDDDERKHVKDVQVVTGSISDERKDIPEILFVSSNENNMHGSKPQNVELFKLLVN